ncbi:hypothetical protein LSAT2_019207 [Lamellibrachia satsuma]|nr:hypothetical protein LSAT2_019207 [Lamellibrachia satsuma]
MEVMEPRGMETEVTVPRGMEVEVMELRGMETEVTVPRGMEMEVMELRGMETEVTVPRGMEMEVMELRGMEMEITEPRGMKMDVTEQRGMRHAAEKLVKLYSSDLDDTLGNLDYEVSPENSVEGAGVARRHKGGGDSAAHDAWNQSSVSFVAARCSPTISVEIEINLCTIYVGVLTPVKRCPSDSDRRTLPRGAGFIAMHAAKRAKQPRVKRAFSRLAGLDIFPLHNGLAAIKRAPAAARPQSPALSRTRQLLGLRQTDAMATTKTGGVCCGRTFGGCLKKYLWEGQKLSNADAKKLEQQKQHDDWHKSFIARYRRPIGLLLPVFCVQFIFWSAFTSYGRWYIFKEKYVMTFTMIFGGLIAGMTSEGGGAVAFPVLTLALHATPAVARDVSLMVQACGMSTATLAIMLQKIQVEYHSVVLCFTGGAIGALGGFYTVDVWLSPIQKKMGFVTIWFSFAFALFLLNRYHKRKTYYKIHNFKPWKAIALFTTGIVGGIFTSFAGGGLDICSFSMLTLLFRVTEKVATPTSVVLMATNSCLCFYWRTMVQQTMSREALDYIGVTAPVVTFMAPIGATLGSHFHRLILAGFVYVLDTVALVSAYIILWPKLWGTPLLYISVGIILFGFGFFYFLTLMGGRTIKEYEALGIADTYEEKATLKEEKDARKGIDNPTLDV